MLAILSWPQIVNPSSAGHWYVQSEVGHHCACSILGAYRQISNTRRTLVGNKFVDHSDVVGALPVGTAPTTSSCVT